LLLAIVLSLLAVKSGANEWPQIHSLEVRVGIERSAERFELTVPIVDLAGKPVYRVLCIGGSDGYFDRLSGTGETNLVGSLASLLNTETCLSGVMLLGEEGQGGGHWHTCG